MKYQLNEMDTADYRDRTKQNIMDSHGTVIISRGHLTGGSKLTKTYAERIGRPNCYLDLLMCEELEAALILKFFIQENKIKTLNVAGPRLSHHPGIYMDVKTILETLLYILFLDTRQDLVIKKYLPLKQAEEGFPKTMKAAIDLLCDDLPLKTKIVIAKFERHNIDMLYFTMLDYVRHRIGFDVENQALLKDCSSIMGHDTYTIEDAVMDILKQLKQTLEPDHILRVVK